MKVQLSDRALADLDRIYAYLHLNRGIAAADQFLQRARKAVEFIGQHPFAGPCPNWATQHRTLRFWVISGTRFLIFHIPEEKAVSIERVLDARRDVIRILEKGLEEPPEETS
jgi:plasmid stabilization system protein ParE